MDAWSSVLLGPGPEVLGARSGGSAAGSPSRATAQPGRAGRPSLSTLWPRCADGGTHASCQGMGGFAVPFPAARSWGCLLTQASHGCQCSTWLPLLSPWHCRIVCQALGSRQDLSLCCTSQREGDGGLELDGTHGSLPLLRLWLLWERKIPGFWQRGNHRKATNLLPEAWVPPLLSPGQDLLTPALLNPYGMQSGGFRLSLISQETAGERLVDYFMLCTLFGPV